MEARLGSPSPDLPPRVAAIAHSLHLCPGHLQWLGMAAGATSEQKPGQRLSPPQVTVEGRKG